MNNVADGNIHTLPDDVRTMIVSEPKVYALWHDITPLARSEWICWMTSGAKAETRTKRIAVGKSKMLGGMRRPCCWAGCPHNPNRKPFVPIKRTTKA